MRIASSLLTFLLEVGAKLGLLGAVLTLFATSGRRAVLAAGLAVATGVIGLARTAWRAERLRLEIESIHADLARAIEKKPVLTLLANRDKGQSATLADAAYAVAVTRSIAVPDLVGSAAGLTVVLVAVAARLGVVWLLLGIACAAVVAVLLAPTRRAARRVRAKGWTAHLSSIRLLDVLLLGSVEVRASGREGAIVEQLGGRIGTLSRAERAGVMWSALVPALPALVGVVALLAPTSWIEQLASSHLAEASIMAAAGAAFALSVLTGIDSLTRDEPQRATLAAFSGKPISLQSALEQAGETVPASDGRTISIESLAFRGVSVRHEGAERRTPSLLSFELRRGAGVVLVGPNGSGKTTALLAAVGLVPLTEGTVLVSGAACTTDDAKALRRRSLFLPQRPLIVPEETLGWHLAMFGTTDVGGDWRAPLAQLGLLPVLTERARKRDIDVADLPMGELSGGEQRKVLLSRALSSDAELLILDEPEVGLDAETRQVLRSLLGELCSSKLVLLVAHDLDVVPERFEKTTVRDES